MNRLAPLVERLLRLALAAVYLVAAWGKLLDPLDFARAIHNYRLLPDAWIVPLALVLPPWEALAALALVTGRFYRGALMSMLLFSITFAVAVASAVARGLDLSCGCFGSGVSSRADLAHVGFNLGAAAAAAWLLHRTRRTSAQPVWSALLPADASSAATARH